MMWFRIDTDSVVPIRNVKQPNSSNISKLILCCSVSNYNRFNSQAVWDNLLLMLGFGFFRRSFCGQIKGQMEIGSSFMLFYQSVCNLLTVLLPHCAFSFKKRKIRDESANDAMNNRQIRTERPDTF